MGGMKSHGWGSFPDQNRADPIANGEKFHSLHPMANTHSAGECSLFQRRTNSFCHQMGFTWILKELKNEHPICGSSRTSCRRNNTRARRGSSDPAACSTAGLHES